MDTTAKFRKQQSDPKGEGKGFEERRQVIIGMYYVYYYKYRIIFIRFPDILVCNIYLYILRF